jgi:hypothetical protein
VTDGEERRAEKAEVIFAFIRRLIVFVLGCWCIGNALLHPDERATQLVIGMIMVGVLPIENIFSWRVTRRDRD